MDGNSRWAKKNNLNQRKGYEEGLNKINEIIDICIEKKIKNLTLYALSTDNNKRSSVGLIYHIMKSNLKTILKKISNNSEVKVKIIGEKKNLPKNIIKILSDLENKTKFNKILNLNIAFNYGSDAELIHIIKNINKFSKTQKRILINKDLIKKYTYLLNTPDPDILIRTGGYQRLSNFLLLQLSYTELFFTKTLWPDFSKKEIFNIFKQYQKIKRNYGL